MRGIGDAYLQTVKLGDGTGKAQKLYPNSFYEMTYSAEVAKLEAKGQVEGRQQTVGAAQGSTTHNFSLTTQYITYANRPLIMGHLPKTHTNVLFPVRQDAIITAADLEVEDPTITAANREFVIVYHETLGPLTPVTAAPATKYEVQVDTATNKLVFHAEALGNVTYTKPVSYANVKGFGGAGPSISLGRMCFRGKVYGWDENSLVEFPALDLTNITELPLTGDVPTFKLDFLAAVPQGWSHPYREIFPGQV
ncbi:MAG TPA: hypothetical protein V6D29_04985 [Leptolyngbyaceae cyanobacterium]